MTEIKNGREKGFITVLAEEIYLAVKYINKLVRRCIIDIREQEMNIYLEDEIWRLNHIKELKKFKITNILD